MPPPFNPTFYQVACKVGSNSPEERLALMVNIINEHRKSVLRIEYKDNLMDERMSNYVKKRLKYVMDQFFNLCDVIEDRLIKCSKMKNSTKSSFSFILDYFVRRLNIILMWKSLMVWAEAFEMIQYVRIVAENPDFKYKKFNAYSKPHMDRAFRRYPYPSDAIIFACGLDSRQPYDKIRRYFINRRANAEFLQRHNVPVDVQNPELNGSNSHHQFQKHSEDADPRIPEHNWEWIYEELHEFFDTYEKRFTDAFDAEDLEQSIPSDLCPCRCHRKEIKFYLTDRDYYQETISGEKIYKSGRYVGNTYDGYEWVYEDTIKASESQEIERLGFEAEEMIEYVRKNYKVVA